jgi:hypothetical protein
MKTLLSNEFTAFIDYACCMQTCGKQKIQESCNNGRQYVAEDDYNSHFLNLFRTYQRPINMHMYNFIVNFLEPQRYIWKQIWTPSEYHMHYVLFTRVISAKTSPEGRGRDSDINADQARFTSGISVACGSRYRLIDRSIMIKQFSLGLCAHSRKC